MGRACGNGGIRRAMVLVRGTVQGVGFRPHVYSLATSLGLRGYVLNSASGLTVDVEGEAIDAFIKSVIESGPPLARIKEVEVIEMPPAGYRGFEIRQSTDEIPGSSEAARISPDVAVCPECMKEVMDPSDRRYRYPFTNCTNCGPRFTIVKAVPYDRASTTMAAFTMCAECEAEYNDPLSRRFHAQPNACPKCGPALTLTVGSARFQGDAIKEAIRLLSAGNIVAVKGIGGFHLACDALNEEAVSRLRAKKRRSNKPFALMAPDVVAGKEFCELDPACEEAIMSPARPIVLLKKKSGGYIAQSVSPGNSRHGVMLPYTPLHYLLFRESNFKALVMTSGNFADEPIVISNDEALSRLPADAFLTHDRDIHMRADDSVVFVFKGNARLIRRSRGYAPAPVEMPFADSPILAVGGELKNAFTLAGAGRAVPSQHIGDMENRETLEFFEESLKNLKAICRIEHEAIAHDMHPDYMTTRRAKESGLKTIPVQHHHAHVASCMSDCGIEGRVIGIVMDGAGYGPDGAIWGGEFMTATYTDFERAGHLKYIPLPGGDMAGREPWRMAISHMLDAYGGDSMDALRAIGIVGRVGEGKVANVMRMIQSGLNCPMTSSTGRLFDAVSSMLGICDINTFEAEAAMALEAVADESVAEAYPANIITGKPMEVDLSTVICSIANDVISGRDAGEISAKFHNSIATACGRVAERISNQKGIKRVCLSGGVFQNALLLKRTSENLRGRGLEVFMHSAVPSNDGGLSLGQAAIASFKAANK